MPRVRNVLAIALVMGLGFGCSPTASTAPSADTSAPPATDGATSPEPAAIGGGGNLVIVNEFEPEGLYISEGGLAATSNKSGPILRNVVEALVGRDQVTAEFIPMLAESWTNTTPTTWEFAIREGVTYHDGSPFNAEAAAAALTEVYKSDLTNFAGSPATFEATDEFTLLMTTEEADPIVPARMTVIPIMNAAQLADDPDGANDAPIGTGPYQVDSWERGSQVSLSLYQDYWRGNPGMYDTVEWVFRAEGAVRAQMIVANEADLALSLGDEQCSGELECVKNQNIGYFLARPDAYNQTLLGDRRVRQAIAMGVNRQAIAAAFLSDGDPLDNPDPRGSVGYDENIVGYDYDVEGAKALLAEAAADGVDLTIPVKVATADILNWEEIAQAMSADLTALGLTSTFEALPLDAWGAAFVWRDGATMQTDLPPDRNTIWLTGNANELLDFSFTAGLFYSCDGILSVYCEPEVDALYEAALPLTGDERQEAFKVMWRRAYDDVALLPISHQPSLYAASDRYTVGIGVDTLIPLWLVGAS